MILHVPLKPMPYKRARASGKGVYVPREYQDWKGEAAMLMRNQMKLTSHRTLEGPVRLDIWVSMNHIEVGFTPHAPEARPSKRPRGDLDNYIKAILDAAQGDPKDPEDGVLFYDDRQVEWINGGFV